MNLLAAIEAAERGIPIVIGVSRGEEEGKRLAPETRNIDISRRFRGSKAAPTDNHRLAPGLRRWLRECRCSAAFDFIDLVALLLTLYK